MSSSKSALKIRAALFDIGGVCVVSPFQAIKDFEEANSIPENWVNFAISRSGPRGAWQQLERGEIKLNDEEFFQYFKRDLHDQKVWEEYWDVYVKRKATAGQAVMTSRTANPPVMDTTTLFWNMMSMARTPDPYMFPTLKYLRSEYPDLVLAALSNTVPFPLDHPFSRPDEPEKDPRSWFDVFISSSDVGLRKPAREIYELAVSEIGKWCEEKRQPEVKPEQIVFLDDIGENCKMGRQVGLQVIKVNLGRTQDAIKILGQQLFGIDDLVQKVKTWEEASCGVTSKL